jgi:pyridoxamine 5'-phosphate oxidase
MEDVSQIRKDYKKFKLDIESTSDNPFEQFNKWMDDALNGGFLEPTAFVLSTVSIDNKPSSRVLLLKGIEPDGYIFYTNYESRKGNELKHNNNAAMLFFWDKFERQVRIEGKIEKINREQSQKYFNSRPYTSQIGAWASEQSKELKSRFTLLRRAAQYMLKFKNQVPLPDFWGGYKLFPDRFEFWQGRESRMHDRIVYLIENGKWYKKRLYP